MALGLILVVSPLIALGQGPTSDVDGTVWLMQDGTNQVPAGAGVRVAIYNRSTGQGPYTAVTDST